MKYYHNKNSNKIVFDVAPRKGKNSLKIYFYLPPKEEQSLTKYPVAFTDIETNQKVFDWFNGVEIYKIFIKEPKYFGLFGSRWREINN